jgi:hypothetical protein
VVGVGGGGGSKWWWLKWVGDDMEITVNVWNHRSERERTERDFVRGPSSQLKFFKVTHTLRKAVQKCGTNKP